jgi:hypothetical protein
MFKKFIEWLTARSVQQIFNVVIDNGIYTHISSKNSSQLMCMSLSIAYYQKLITKTECLKAKAAIHEYLGDDYMFLEKFLQDNGYYFGFVARLTIYKDWENRPPRFRFGM